jgi:hypothetical protein
MGLTINLNIERQEQDRWVNPIELAPVFPRRIPGSTRDVKVCSFSARSLAGELFFGPQARIVLQEGLPPDLTPELEWHRKNRIWPDGSKYHGWILLEDLRLPLWQTEHLMLCRQVPLRLVQTFGNGKRSRSELLADLAATGLSDRDCCLLLEHDVSLSETAEDWSNYRRYELAQLPHDATRPVTWLESFVDFVGPTIWDKGLARLLELTDPAQYRIVFTAS